MINKLRETWPYTIVILKKGPLFANRPETKQIIWEHGRRNFSLKANGLMPIVCPVNDGSEISGIGIFNADVEETKILMEDDPGVKDGIFVFEIHPTRSFPGSCLP